MTVKEMIILTATYYSKTLSEPLLAMYCDDLEGLPAQKIIDAYRAYRRDPRNRSFPIPAQIRAMIENEPTNDAIAREIVARIVSAIGSFGWNNSSEAKKFIGQTGWLAVDRIGGWSYLCQEYGLTIQPGQFMPQIKAVIQDRLDFGSNLENRALTGFNEQKLLDENQPEFIKKLISSSKNIEK